MPHWPMARPMHNGVRTRFLRNVLHVDVSNRFAESVPVVEAEDGEQEEAAPRGDVAGSEEGIV